MNCLASPRLTTDNALRAGFGGFPFYPSVLRRKAHALRQVAAGCAALRHLIAIGLL
jgi:hypothetical protein